MATVENLFNTTQDFLRPEFIHKASIAIGQPTEKILLGLRSVIPTFLLGLVDKGSSPEGAQSLIHLAQKDGVEAVPPSNFEDGNYLSKGEDALHGIFGPNLNSVISSIGSSTGLNANNVNKMMGMIAPIVMGVIERKVKNEGMNADRLMGFLRSQKPALRGTSVLPKDSRPIVSYATTEGVMPYYANFAKLWIGLAIIALFIIGYLWWWTSQTAQIGITPPGRISMVETIERSISPITPIPPAHLNEFESFLSSGNEAELPKRFSFQNLIFATGEPELLKGSEQELNQIAEAMKRNPAALIRLEAFTDNVGDPAVNQELSENRAVLVKEELVARGVVAERIEAIGRGQESPLASNETPEGRAKNRRVELTVTGIK